MNQNAKNRLFIAGLIAVVAVVLYANVFMCSCGALKNTAWVGLGSGVGAVAGSPLGPPGMAGGAVVGGAVTHAVVDSDAQATRADRLEDKLTGAPAHYAPPPWYDRLGLSWIAWLVIGYLVFRNRAHLISLVNGREPRLSALLRLIGAKTHIQ